LQKAPRAQPLFRQQTKDEQFIILSKKDDNLVFEGSVAVSDSIGSKRGKFLSEKQIGIFVLATVSPYKSTYGDVLNTKH
jgi:hypothetical protein